MCESSPVRTLALDVDGVLLDPDRGGLGNWTDEIQCEFGITRSQIQATFFERSFNDVLNGRRPVEEGIAEAFVRIGVEVDVEAFLAVWFEADFAPIDATIALAVRAGQAGWRVSSNLRRLASGSAPNSAVTWCSSTTSSTTWCRPAPPVGKRFTPRQGPTGSQRPGSSWASEWSVGFGCDGEVLLAAPHAPRDPPEHDQ